MFTARRGHRSHLVGKDGGKDWWSPSLCHVSCKLILYRKCTLSIYDYTFHQPFSSCRHKLADQKTRKTLDRGDFRLLHYAGEVTYCVIGERFFSVLPSISLKQWLSPINQTELLLWKLSGFLDKNNDLLYRSGKEVISFHLHVLTWKSNCVNDDYLYYIIILRKYSMATYTI